jgi:flagellar hook assembly protein FlgD
MITTLQYDLPQSGPVKISIYDIHGRSVRVLKDRHETAGVKRVIWDGKDQTGTEISSGVYVVRLVSGSRVQMRKIVLQK